VDALVEKEEKSLAQMSLYTARDKPVKHIQQPVAQKNMRAADDSTGGKWEEARLKPLYRPRDSDSRALTTEEGAQLAVYEDCVAHMEYGWLHKDAKNLLVGECVRYDSDFSCLPRCFVENRSTTDSDERGICTKLCQLYANEEGVRCNMWKVAYPFENEEGKTMWGTNATLSMVKQSMFGRWQSVYLKDPQHNCRLASQLQPATQANFPAQCKHQGYRPPQRIPNWGEYFFSLQWLTIETLARASIAATISLVLFWFIEPPKSTSTGSKSRGSNRTPKKSKGRK